MVRCHTKDFIYFLRSNIVFLILILDVVSCIDFENSCKKEWVRVQRTKGNYQYVYRVDCSNLGFESVPVGLRNHKLTSELLLNGNSISTLDDQALAGLTSLHTLDLSGNDIVTLNASVLKDIKQLKRLDLSRNKIRCDTRIWWLVQFAKKLDNFTGDCFSPRPLRTRPIQSLKEEDLSVDCLSVKQLRNTSEDGEYNIRVFAKDNSKKELCVYCYQMKSDSPKEYLTLPAGVHHNYVRLRRDDRCDYKKDEGLQKKLGLLKKDTSYFMRVRIILTSLTILTTDTTFGSNNMLKYGQPGLCGDNVCTGGYAKIDLRGTHFHIKDDKKIIATRRCNAERCRMCNVSDTIPLSMMDIKKYPYLACTLPLGLQNGHIRNSSVNASSSFPGTKPFHARLNSLRYSGWCAEYAYPHEYLRVDLGKVKTLSGISTQGHKTEANWVTSYHVLYSSSGNGELKKYREFGRDIDLKGNFDSNTVSTHWFQPRFRARYITVKPLTWNGNETNGNKICMRVELYGCDNDITSYIIKPELSSKCLTIDIKNKTMEGSYPLTMGDSCSGPGYMFSFSTNRLMHAQSGLCMHLSRRKVLVLNKQCSSSNIQFQKVRQKNGRDAFLIKDGEKCAKIYHSSSFASQQDIMQLLWSWCLKGGFSVLYMTRKGVTPFSPIFDPTIRTITTDLFEHVEFECRVRADPLATFRWSKNALDGPLSYTFKNGRVIERKEYSILKFSNISWEDRGTYYCNAWNSRGNTSRKYVVNVNAMQWWHRQPTHQKIIYGNTAIFHCVSRGIPTPEVRWVKYKDGLMGNPIPIKYNRTRYSVYDNSTLVINKVMYDDEGVYMCISTSPNLIRNVSASLDVYVTQKFTAVPKPQHVLFGNGTIFKCVSEGRPPPVVTWKMALNSVRGLIPVEKSLEHQYEVLPDNSLHVKQVTFSDEGRFICISKSPGLLVNRSASLTVFVTQRFTKIPVNQKVLYGYNATLECVSVGVPTPRVQWMKMDVGDTFTQLFSNHKYVITENNTLHIGDVRYEDETEYFCFSLSPRLKRNVSAMLDVYVTQNFTKSPVDLKTLFGYNVSFECVSVGIPKPRVTWYKKVGNTLQLLINSRRHVITSEGLYISNVTYLDEAEYICDSQSPRLRRNKNALLDVYVTQNFTTRPKDTGVLYEHNVTFECTSVGIPTPRITWARKMADGYEVLTSNEKYNVSGERLTIMKANYEDEREYACISESPRLRRNATAMLDVFVTQKFDVRPRGGKVLYGHNYALHCASSGIPKPKVTWKFRQYNRITAAPVQITPKINVTGNGSLFLYDVTLSQHGEYYCVSESPGYTTNASAFVKVYVTQKFTKEPKSQKLIKGQDAIFHCEASGSPTPTIYWKRQNIGERMLTDINRLSNGRFKLNSDQSLVIKDIQNEDEGDYVCMSESPGLLVNRTARLIVYIKPKVKISRTSKHLHIGNSISVNCTVVEGDPRPQINWYKVKRGERELVHTGPRLIFRSVTKANQSKYLCEAENLVGVAFATFDLTVTATCLLGHIENSHHSPNKYKFNEGGKVTIKCNKGFSMRRGTSKLLTCTETGTFNPPLPVCADINECNGTVNIVADDPGSGVGPEIYYDAPSDDEPDVCDYNARCINTHGSFRCVCNEMYVMVNNKCEYEPKGGTSIRPQFASTRAPTTAPPPEKYAWLKSLRESFKSGERDEGRYLSDIRRLSSTVIRKPYDSWKVEGIKKVLESMKVAVDLADKGIEWTTPAIAMDRIRTFGFIVSNILDSELKDQWGEINKEMNGSVLVMKYLEEYAVAKAKVLKSTYEEYFSNLNIKIVPVQKIHRNKTLEMAVLQGDQGNIIDMPLENYVTLKDKVGIAILYKNLHKIFPKPYIPQMKNPKVASKLFTLSFGDSKRTSLIKPVRIRFKLNASAVIPDKRLCTYWDWDLPYEGGWSTDGCEPLNISTASEVICECTHMSNFAILVPQKTAQKIVHLTVTLSVAVGVAACIVLAFCTCMSHVCCSGYGSGDRQAIMANITVVIILGLMVFAGGVFLSAMKWISDAYSLYFCFSLLGIIQLLAVACFGWIFAESLHILFSTRPVIEKRSSNVCLFYILGWVVPVGLLAITGVLVYLDKFQLQSRCSLKISFYLVGILVGAPSICYILATIVVYVIICISTNKNVEVLGSMKVSHARRSLLCSGILIVFHLALLGAVTLYLHFNMDQTFHHILGGVAAAEGIYLIIYHMFLDRLAGRIKAGSPRTRQRNSYSTKETITYAPNVPNGSLTSEEKNPPTEQTRFLIKTSSKRSSIDNTKPTPPQLRTPDESNTLEWDNHVGGDMYGEQGSPIDVEMKPMLSKQLTQDQPPTIYEEEKDFSIETGLDTFGKPNVERQDTLPRSYNSLTRKKQMTRDFDEVSADGSFRPGSKRAPTKSNSIVSIETHTSNTSSQQSGLPIYFPSAPPHHEIYFDEKKKPESVHTNEDYLESTETSRPASFGIDSDRMSNLSSELSNILYELQAFNTDRHPSESQPNVYDDEMDRTNANTLPHRSSAENAETDLSKTSSTFKPGRAYAKTEVQYDSTQPPTIEHHRVRVLRGRSRNDADPSDGLHGNSDSIYSSL